MNHYMVNVILPKELNEEFISLIPRQRAQVNELMDEGIVTSYSLARDRSRLWVTIAAESEEEVIKIMNDFPLIKFFTLEIRELMFHNHMRLTMPQMSLN